MRILAVNWLDRENPQAGGAEIHFFEIFSRLAGRGHEVTLVTSGWSGGASRSEIDGIEVRRFGGRHSFALRGRPAVRHVLRETRFDVVVEDINKLPLYLPTLTRLPMYVIVPHLFGTTAFSEASWPVASLVWLAERPIPVVYRRAAYHAISQSTCEDLVSRGVSRSAIRVILPGVDSTWFSPDPATTRCEKPTFLYVGRLKRYKGLDTVLRAMALTRAEGHDFRLDIAGRGDDLPRLEQLAGSLQLGEAVRFLGFVGEEEKRRLLRQAWAVVFPSAKEGWGIANVEAAACGTPAVASDSPGLRESVRDQDTGLLVPHDDAAAMARALTILGSQRNDIERLGSNARRFAETLSWDHTADQTETHLLETATSAR